MDGGHSTAKVPRVISSAMNGAALIMDARLQMGTNIFMAARPRDGFVSHALGMSSHEINARGARIAII